jgi:putative hydrolase of the HAD superfamily
MKDLPVDAVLFDLDDTLVDRPRSLRKFAREFVRFFFEEMADLDEERTYEAIKRADWSGYRPRTDMARELLHAMQWKHGIAEGDIVAFWNREFPSCSVAEEGAERVLVYLKQKGLRTGIITNSTRDFQLAKLDHVGLVTHLDVVVISEDVGLQKPDARIFRLAVDRLATAPARAVFVGDNPELDILGAKNAGLFAIWKRAQLPWPVGIQEPDFTIRKLDELTGLV